MSSTNRSNARDYHIVDYYVTPKQAIKKFISEFVRDEKLDISKNFLILDPCAGWNSKKEFTVPYEDEKQRKELEKVADRVFHWDWVWKCTQEEKDMSYPAVLFEFWNYCLTNDLREDSKAILHSDFLTWKSQKKYTDDYEWWENTTDKYDMVITNPPFAIAREIIEKSLEVTKEWWYVIMLLRLNYIGSSDRAEFWRTHKPYAIYADNKRMSFTPDGWTDSIEYAHFVWKKWENPDFAKFKILT